jgi:hypothetical protein
MGETPGFAFSKLPAGAGRPQRRQLVVSKSGTHADFRVMQGHAVRADGPNHRRGCKSHARSKRLARQEQARPASRVAKQQGQPVVQKVVEKQIGHHDVGAPGRSRLQPVEHVGPHRLNRPRQRLECGARLRRHQRLLIDQNRARRRAC